MTETEILKHVNISDDYKAEGCLKTKKILQNIGNARFYCDMDTSFLAEIHEITGIHNGIIVTDNSVCLTVNTSLCAAIVGPISTFDMVFDKVSGEHTGFCNIIFFHEMLSSDEKEFFFDDIDTENAFQQIMGTMDKALLAAYNRGYYS